MRSKTRSKFSLNHLLVLAAAATLSPPAPAAAAPCLTHSEARAKYPDAHLYWHRSAHCWDTSRRGGAHYDEREPDVAPRLAVDQATAVKHTTVYYPAMEVNAWPSTVLPLDAHDMSSWPILLDVDRPMKFDAWGSRVQGAWSK